MLMLLCALLSSLCSMFRTRAELELENIALRHQIGVLKRSARKTAEADYRRPRVLDLAFQGLVRLALRAGRGQA